MYLAFEYIGSRHATIGEPNRITGRCCKAGNLKAFKGSKMRDDWVDEKSHKRDAVTKKEARKLLGGLTVAEFQKYIALVRSEMDGRS